MDINNLILIFFLISFGTLFYKYFILIISKYSPKLLIDDQLKKPQAFHVTPTPIVGGYIFHYLKILFFLSIYHFVHYFFSLVL